MPTPEVYCMFCAARDYCAEQPNALPNLPGHAEPECFVEPRTAVKVQHVEPGEPVDPGENYEMLF